MNLGDFQLELKKNYERHQGPFNWLASEYDLGVLNYLSVVQKKTALLLVYVKYADTIFCVADNTISLEKIYLRPVWYVPDGLDPAPFEKWFPKIFPPNIRCNQFYIAEATQNCAECSFPVKMVAFVLPRGWQEWVIYEDDTRPQWEAQDSSIILNYVGLLNHEALVAVQTTAPEYKLVIRPQYYSKRYLNHCNKCGASQQEPNSGNTHVFKPDTIEKARAICLHHVSKPFEGHSAYPVDLANYGYDAFEFMRLSEKMSSKVRRKKD